MKIRHLTWPRLGVFAAGLLLTGTALASPAHAQGQPQGQAQAKRTNIVMLMTDDTGMAAR